MNEVNKPQTPSLPTDYKQEGLTAVTVYVPNSKEDDIQQAALDLRHKAGVYLPNDLIF